MNSKYWIGLIVFPLLVLCNAKSNVDAYQYELLDSLVFNTVLVDLGEKLFFDPFVLTRALSAFQRNIYSEDSDFDDWKKKGILKDSALVRSYNLFDEVLNCTQCHNGNSFTDNSLQNNGLYSVYQDSDRYNITGDSTDIGKFKVPSLRNVSVTAPFMYNGGFDNLYSVLQHYETGGKTDSNKSPSIQSFSLTDNEREDLLYFLNSLTDKRFVN